MPIQRITSFKFTNESDVPGFLEQYKVLEKENQKDGKPYVLSVNAYPLVSDPRNQGYNVSAVTIFKDMEDVKYYDDQCEAHKNLKAWAGGKVQTAPLTLLMEVPA
ncbi:Hypothetical predicted protein [Lecanosticta acicola]|uniref:Stress-response A/B barrel domain-containing protein n=1 Tax=Lecanosticta acicola TaxID=111012 RepID=A0AAI8Z1C4_9PEZI|nr:Hypothetical predicted protein [Lecanosticta acicola]